LYEPAISGRFHQFVAEMEHTMARALAAERGVDADGDLDVQLAAQAATAIYMAAFHVHVHTGRDLVGLVNDGFKRFRAGIGTPPKRVRARAGRRRPDRSGRGSTQRVRRRWSRPPGGGTLVGCRAGRLPGSSTGTSGPGHR